MPPRELGGGCLGDRGDVRISALQTASRNPRKIQQVIDEARHSLCSCAHALEIVQAAFVESLARIIFEQGFAEAVDRSQRRAEIVRNRVGEGLQLLVGGIEFTALSL